MELKSLKAVTSAVALLALGAGLASAGEDDQLIINGETEMVTRTEAPAHMEYIDEIRSGWTFRSDETQALQMDDFDNPGMIFVDQGLDTWNEVDGSEGKSCASCHDGPESLAGLRAAMPKYNEAAGEVWTMEMYINDCRENRMGAEKWGWNSNPMVNTTALISLQSRGMPVDVKIDGPAQETWEKGKEIYYTRYGQLELSCANCHEDNYDNLIRADHLSQGQINGFPAYRLKNAKLNSIHNRFKGCIRDTRAETFKEGSAEFIALELYVASRGNGLSVEGPSVRN
ncbi:MULTISPECIES: sulfur oxidation c-type cytochrome SoxA [Actibacterium]|uniref:SoxAX cytochrome complex subunit A n=1 Tax=Actibacterium naphthalenivorans TaxID=1614693 RepID=A0A840CM78_9RHOB|nr:MULTISPECIES: sulfur oxidation c-type cytochrome SoxA [Actibacterium]ALG90689.1 cytochrome C [Actibacterium sp. EMB200-NS6]MBB4023117.1 sulfur-oxidizing protein SoxA [Actibacterium naphthalenivorans]